MVSIRFRVCLAVALILAVIVAATGWVDKRGVDYTEDGLKRALVTFAISRTLNGVISVAQGTEVAVEPVGIGMTFTPGQILDPVNDLIERFSTVVLVAGTAFGAQRVLIEVTASPLYNALCIAVVLIALLMLIIWSRVNPTLSTTVIRISITILFVRLAVPVYAVSSELFYQQFLAPQFQESSAQLNSEASRLSIINEQKNEAYARKLKDKSFIESARDWIDGASANLDWKKQLAEFSETAERISLHAIRLMVVFVFQTVLLPLLGVWLVVSGCKQGWKLFKPKPFPTAPTKT